MNNYQVKGSVKDIADNVQGKVVTQVGSLALIASISVIFGIMMGVLGTAVLLIQTIPILQEWAT